MGCRQRRIPLAITGRVFTVKLHHQHHLASAAGTQPGLKFLGFGTETFQVLAIASRKLQSGHTNDRYSCRDETARLPRGLDRIVWEGAQHRLAAGSQLRTTESVGHGKAHSFP